MDSAFHFGNEGGVRVRLEYSKNRNFLRFFSNHVVEVLTEKFEIHCISRNQAAMPGGGKNGQGNATAGIVS